MLIDLICETSRNCIDFTIFKYMPFHGIIHIFDVTKLHLLARGSTINELASYLLIVDDFLFFYDIILSFLFIAYCLLLITNLDFFFRDFSPCR